MSARLVLLVVSKEQGKEDKTYDGLDRGLPLVLAWGDQRVLCAALVEEVHCLCHIRTSA